MASATRSTSRFSEAALELDRCLIRFEDLVREMEHLAIQSDKGMDGALTLLAEIAECRTQMESGMRALSRTLEEARVRNEKAEELLSVYSVQVEERQRQSEQMFARFRALGNMATEVDEVVKQLREKFNEELLDEARSILTDSILNLEAQLGVLTDEAKTLVEDARAANLQFLERNADAMRKSLAAARNRIKLLAKSKQGISLVPDVTVN